MQIILVAMLLGLAVENNLVSSGLYLFWELIVPGANRDFLLAFFFFFAAAAATAAAVSAFLTQYKIRHFESYD